MAVVGPEPADNGPEPVLARQIASSCGARIGGRRRPDEKGVAEIVFGIGAERPRRGIGKLALRSGATVVPVAIHGSERVRNWKRLRFPRVTVNYGEPIEFEHEQEPTRERQQEVADQIFGTIKELYAAVDDSEAKLRKEAGQGAMRSLIRNG